MDAPTPTTRLQAVLRTGPLGRADVSALRAALADGADPNALFWPPRSYLSDQMTALHVVGLSRDNPLEAAEALIAAGADLHARSARSGWTPLHVAAALNHTALVTLLLDHGADPTAVANNRDAPTPLVACLIGRADLCLPTVEVLLARGADPNHVPPGYDGPLHRAVDCGNVPAIHRLVAAGADVDARSGATTWGQRTPLMEAVTRGRHERVDVLLALGADVNATSAVGRTALHTAVLREQPHHVRTLLARGAAVNARANDGHTPLTAFLAWRHRATPLELVELLLAHGADPCLVDAEGTPTLHLALHKGEAEVVQRLVAAGASLDQPDAAGRSARDLAPTLPALLQVALGLPPAGRALPPTRAFLDGLASGLTWTRGGSTLARHADQYAWTRRGAPRGRFTDETIREHVAWLALHDEAAAASLAAWLSDRAVALGQPRWSVTDLRGALEEQEPELVARVRLPLEPAHAPLIIEAGVRAGLVPCRHDKEGFWTWTFLPDAPEAEAFRFHEAGDHNPRGTIEHRSAEALRQFFSRFSLVDGRLSAYRRHDLDDALERLGFETERQWLAARSG